MMQGTIKILIFLIASLYIMGCSSSKSLVIPLTAKAKAKVQEHRKIYVALPTSHSIWGSKGPDEYGYITSGKKVLLPIIGDLDFASDTKSFKIEGEKKKILQIKSPNLPLARNLVDHIKLQHKDLQVLYLYDTKIPQTEDKLQTDGLWLQVEYFYTYGFPTSAGLALRPGVFSYYGFAFRSFAYLVDPISKQVLWQGACRKWFFNEDKYFLSKQDFKKNVIKFRRLNIQSFVKSCTGDLIRQWEEKTVSGPSYTLANCAKPKQAGCSLGKNNINIYSRNQMTGPIERPGYERLHFTKEEKKKLNAMVEEYYNKI